MNKLLAASLFAAVAWGQEKVDLGVIQRIKKEAFENSKVMDHLFWLTEVYGPRLAGVHCRCKLDGKAAQGIRN